MFNFKSRIFVAIFLFLATIITIYPPFNWDKEIVQKHRYRMYEVLPIKEHDFLFAPSQRQIQIGWSWDSQNQKSLPFETLLHRRLDFSELILYYILALLTAAIVDFSISYFHRNRKPQ